MRITRVQSYEKAVVGVFDCRIFIDVLRASTTLATILGRAPRQLVCANERGLCDRLIAAGWVLFSEVFDGGYGNSPTQALATPLAGKDVVHKSANFSNALFRHGGDGVLMAASYVNLHAVAAAVLARGARSVLIVTGGSYSARQPTVEDDGCADLLAELLQHPGADVAPKFRAQVAAIRADLARETRRPDTGPGGQFRADVEYALQLDACAVVPSLRRADETSFVCEITHPSPESLS